jgi:nucleotide-binding universal stress UspA family protein/predicted Ser/Thr protein kinase
MRAGLVIGTQIDGFRIDAPLHSGSNAFVYRVSATTADDPGFPLMMKVPAVGPAQPPLTLVSFEMECAILHLLTGPYVPRLVAVGDLARTPYLVMEYIEGTSLAALTERAPLPADEVARVGAALADAVHSVHLQEVQHMDLKPENFILRPSGEAVLLDFGYARHSRYPDLLAEERHLTAGSAPYVSPEQLNEHRGDPRSDLFALGALLYELASGEPPFGTPATYAGMRDRLWRAPVPLRALRPDVAPWLQEIVLHLLEVDAARRYDSAAHVAFDLRHPEQVSLTERATGTRPVGFARQLARWWRAARAPRLAVALPRSPAPVIMVGVDTEHPDDDRLPALQSATRRLIAASPEYRLMCISVIHAGPLGEGPALTDTASGRHLEHAIRLRHWVEPLGLPPMRQSLHVVEAADAAGALLDLARANHVDVIVLGAPRPGDKALGWWRSTASRVTAQAPCSVHLARVPLRD